MNRSLKLSMLVALALASTPALALELGQIQVKSALDRPLVAEIPLQPDHPGEADHVKVILAPDAAFARAGISRDALKVPLSFEVVTNDGGQKVIRVTSTQPVREPYLDFLVQVSWPKGKLLREYTVLLDPLSMHSAPGALPAKAPAPAAKPAPAAPAPEPASAPAPSPGQTAAPAASAPAGEDVYGPVTYGDTLSHIARTHAIGGVSYQQMLVALKAANPDAFFRDNVNALKTGAVLRIPTRAQALTVTRKSAIAAVRSQNQSWQSQHASAPTMVAGTGGSSAPVTGSDQPASSGDRLHLVSPDEGGASAGAAAGEASAAELRQDLARSKEALSSQKQTIADLQSRVTALEQIADKNKRLIALKNDEIAALQQKLADARQAAGLPALPASALAPAASTAAVATAGAAPSVANAASAAVAPLAMEASTNPATATTSVAHAGNAAAPANDAAAGSPSAGNEAATSTPAAGSQSAPASAPWYTTLWARVVLGIIIVLLIIWMLLRRRKPAAKPARKSLADDFGDSPLGASAAADEAVDHDDEYVVDRDDDRDEVPEPFVDDDGEDELLAQLAEHPDNIGLHLELASLYYSRRDAGRFEGAAEAMHAYVDDESQPEWQDVVTMGRELVPDHPLFLADAPSADEPFGHEDAVSFGESDHFSDEDAHARATDASASDATNTSTDALSGADDDDDHHFDFDLAPEPTAASEDASEAPATGLPDESEFDALPPLPVDDEDDDVTTLPPVAPEPPLSAEPGTHTPLVGDDSGIDLSDDDGFSDDPVDTKLDLARAYMEMGDREGARAMLTEALHEGSQPQKDTAQKLLDELD
ncbi:MAG TPA: FimV/HubP family polar landmark protein [Oleiagrimonas sp.]|nr:FimV/HubP family polar landmark protein [Oleiagrimonas sp.]